VGLLELQERRVLMARQVQVVHREHQGLMEQVDHQVRRVLQVHQEHQVQMAHQEHQVQVELQALQEHLELQEKVFNGRVISPTVHFIREIPWFIMKVVHILQ
jgi:hypothetical protein